MPALRALFLLGLLVLFSPLSSLALSRGEYQQTKDGKTTVWNANPKPGETASWDAGRDKEGYATGFGALTWYDADGKGSILYFGNMVHGKFEGPVNAHTGGKTLHAYFYDGARVTTWARGPAPSRMAVPESVQRKRREEPSTEEREQPPPSRESTSQRAEQKPEVKSQPPPSHKATPSHEEVRKPQPSSVKPFAEPTAFPSPTASAANATSEISQPPPSSSPSATPEISPPPASAIPEVTGSSTPTPSESSSPATQPATNRPPTNPEPSAEESLRSLVAPPSSLRSTPEASPTP